MSDEARDAHLDWLDKCAKVSERYADIRGVKFVDPPVRSVSIKSEVALLEEENAALKRELRQSVDDGIQCAIDLHASEAESAELKLRIHKGEGQ